MWKKTTHRLFSALFVVAIVMLINFALYHLSPGDPSSRYLLHRGDSSNQEIIRHYMGMDRPLSQQLFTWFANFVRGDFGYSWFYHRSVNDVLAEAIPATLELTLTALVITFVLGITLGLYAGLRTKKWTGKALSVLQLILYSVPHFWLAALAIYLFSFKLGWLPASGQAALGAEPGLFGTIWDHCRHLIMPAMVLGLVGSAAVFRIVKSHTSAVLAKPYILAAQSRGLPTHIVLYKHALKNILLPLISLIGLYFPFLLSGALIIEVIFAWPGMGRIAYEAVLAKDFPLIMAVNYLAAVMIIIGNFIADLLYAKVDPRI